MSIQSKFHQLGRVASDSRWWPFYLQRRFMGASLRPRLADSVARLRPAVGAEAGSAHNAAVSAHVERLRADGISHLGALLSPPQATEVVDWLKQRQVHDPYRPAGRHHLPEGVERHPDSHIAHHRPQDILAAPYLFEIANRPDILAVAGRFLGCRPTLGYMAAWWSYPTALGAQQAEHFHRDVDDWRFVKLFVYLTDVGPSNGPHVYVKQSSAAPQLREIRRFDDREVRTTFGDERVLCLTARAGEGFFEDTFGLHKGQPVDEGRRLIFQAVYSMFPLPYGPKAPVARWQDLPDAVADGRDRWVNRLYVGE